MSNDWGSQEEIDKLNAELLASNPIEIEYRLYVDDSGKALFYCSNNFPETGKYVTVSKEIYEKCNMNLEVRDNELVSVVSVYHHSVQLQKGGDEYRTAKGHAAVLDTDEELTDVEYFQKRFITTYKLPDFYKLEDK